MSQTQENNPIHIGRQKYKLISINMEIFTSLKEASESLNISEGRIRYRINSTDEKYENWKCLTPEVVEC